MELDLGSEQARVEGEIQDLFAQMEQLDQKRQELANEIVRRQGILAFLERLPRDGHKGGR